MRSKQATSPSVSTTVRRVPLRTRQAPARIPSSCSFRELELQAGEVTDVVEGNHRRCLDERLA